PLGSDSLPGTPVVWHAPGPTQPTYFGFTFDASGHLIVSEPLGTAATIPAAEASAVSSFTVAANGSLQPISTDVANGQSLSCWAVVDPLTGQYAFIGNNGSSNVSTYKVGADGALTLLNKAAGVSRSPNDLAVAADGTNEFLYALNAGNG